MAGADRLRIQVFGAVRAWRNDDELVLGPARQRAVLGLLALAVGRPLGSAEMIDSLWGEDPPSSARNVVQTYVKHLRRILEPHRPPYAGSTVLPRVNSGYLLRLPGDDIDVVRFRRVVADSVEAQRRGDQRRVATLLGEALRLWRGAPLADIPGLSHHPKAVALIAERRAALARYGAAMIAIGCASEALPTLEEAAAEQPLDEPTQARLILAYRAAGHRAEALATYERVRERLADELGVDPGPEVVAANRALLADETPVPVTGRPPVPAQLPADIVAFTGRAEHLRRLDELLPEADAAATPAVVVSAVSGTAGVGKTALAVHWAHRVAYRFPDGQLYVNLRGFDPSGQAMDPAEAVRGFLDALQIPPAQIPAGLDSQAGLYRSLVSGKRMLVLLDNARDAEQVRPLLPGSPGCLVVVTSRNQLTSLVVAEGAHPVILDLLTTGEARELLAHRLGANRVTAQPDAVDEIIARCARLPLALATVAARAATYPDFSLGALAAELRGLEGFNSGDPVTDLPASFSWSYRSLGAGAARLFRLLGMHPGPDLGLPAMASLAGADRTATRTWLAELTRDHLVVEHSPGRYTLHDLLRAYAAGLSTEDDRGAVRRMVDHYLHTASAAAAQFNHHHQDAVTPGPTDVGVAPERIDDHGHALAWFTIERRALVAVVCRARVEGFDTHAWQLACTLTNFFDRRGYWDDLATTQRTALAAATQLDDRAAQAVIHRNLSAAHARRGRYDEARRHLRHSLDLFVELGDHTGQARTHLNLAQAAGRQGHHGQALAHAQEALDLYRLSEHRAGQANAFNAIGWYHVQLGDHRQALLACQRALALFQRLGDRAGEAGTWDSIGFAHHGLGDHEQALTCYHNALELFRSLGDRYYEADTLMHLGETHRAAGDIGAATDAWQHALAILEEFGHADTEHVRDLLAASQVQ